MGKRPRTPHFIAGIGDGNVHDGNDDVFRLRGNNNNNDNSKNKKNGGTSTDDDEDNNINNINRNRYHSNQHSNRHQQQNRYDLRNHRPDRNNVATGGNDKFSQQQHEEEEESAPWSLDAGAFINEHITHVPDMKFDMMGDIVQQLPTVHQLQTTGGGGSGLWQVSAFAFLGVLVIISAIILHFVSESAGSSSGSNSKKCINTSTFMSSNNNNNNDSSPTSRHHSGSNSRQYRRRQRRLQKLQKKKKTDIWSDDEEPIQDGGRFFSMNDKILSSLSRDDDGGGGYGSPPNEYDENEYENNDNEYGDYDNNNNNNSIYHQSDYYREPNSHLAAQHSRLRRTGITATATSATPTGTNTSTTNNITKEPYDYYDVGVVPTYKSPAASKYMMQTTTTKSSSTASAVFRSTTTPQRGISPMNSYSSGGGGGGSRQRRPNNNNNNFNSSSLNNSNIRSYHSEKSNFSPTGSTSSPYRDFGIAENNNNNNNNNYKYNNGFIAITPSSTKTPISGKLRIPPTPDAFTMTDGQHQQSSSSNDDGNNRFHSDASSSSSNLLPTPRHQNQSSLLVPNTKDTITEDDMGGVGNKRIADLGARLLDTGSRFSSFASMGDVDSNENENYPIPNNHDRNYQRTIEDRRDSETWSRASGGGYGELCDVSSTLSRSQSPHHLHNNNESPSISMNNESFSSINSRRQHQESLALTPGNSEETPIIGNARKTIIIKDGVATSLHAAALLPPMGISDDCTTHDQADPVIPYIPSLKTSQCGTDTGLSYPLLSANAPPRSITMDELRLVEMETGNSMHWDTDHEDFNTSFAGDYGDDHVDATTGKVYPSSNQRPSSDDGSDISIPSGDPRKSIIHKRQNLTMSTDSATSLQSSINFEELQLQEIIGGGGFGQVWKATWRGTPVAVKVLTGSAQNAHIPKAVSEEFKAEINLLKGMRHPNICLYMGACLTPPNRAIITELAANGSAWDSLRLPLMPPYVAADGTPRGSWPLRLYLPSHHGAPPSSHGSKSPRTKFSAPIPPRGTWPWELVKRVSCGAARGMAYLHSGNPPVLHRDLKSANLLLDESYTAKVCDFGLSRLKAQARSMTANCGTVQWMAPEVLANRSYDEKADIYSFGIIVWELLTRECPYEGMTAIQCALAVLNRDKRPEIPKWCPPQLHALIKSCIKTEPSERPSFPQIILALDAIE